MTSNEMLDAVRKLSGFPQCMDSRADCINKKLGRCLALDDSRFSYPCPFYKTIAENEEQLRRLNENKTHRGKTNKY